MGQSRPMRRFFVLSFFVLGFIVAPAVRADTAQDQALAASLMAAGRAAEAEAIIARLRAVNPPDLQTLFLSGMLHLGAGRFEKAAEEFRLMLTRDPTLLRPRLELARALYMNRDYESSRYHFEQVLATPLPDTVRTNVLGYLSDIRTRVPSFGISFDLVSDSNPRSATSIRTVEILGLPLKLSEDSRAKKRYGVQMTAQAKLPLPSNPNWYATGYFENLEYPGRDLDQTYLQLVGGRHFEWTAQEINIELGGHYAAYQGTDLYRGPVGRLSYSGRLRDNMWGNITLDARELRYTNQSNNRFLSGWQHAQSFELRWAPTTSSMIVPNFFFIERDARDRGNAFNAFGLGMRYGQEWPGGWLTQLSAQYSKFDYRDVDGSFAKVRDDEEWRAELSIAHRQFSLFGFAPRMALGYIDHRSNIPFYSFDRFFVRVGVTKDY